MQEGLLSGGFQEPKYYMLSRQFAFVSKGAHNKPFDQSSSHRKLER